MTREEFEAWLERDYTGLVQIIVSQCHVEPDEAADLLHTAVARILAAKVYERFHGRTASELRGYVVARAGWLGRHRVRKSRAEERRRERIQREHPDEPEDQSVVATEAEERLAHMARILSTLSPRTRQLVEGYYLKGLSQTELANMHGMRQRTISRRLRRALALLSRRLRSTV